MSRLRKFLLVTLGVGLAGAIAAAFGTGTAQAVVASLVEIVNPTTAPVPILNVTDPGRVAYQSTINNVGKCSGGVCLFSFPSVPAGHRVAVQHISGYLQFNSAPPYIEVFLLSQPSNATFAALFAPNPTSAFSGVIDQPALFYVDASGSVSAEVLGGNATFAGDSAAQFLTLTGYELDCTVAACPAIATQ